MLSVLGGASMLKMASGSDIITGKNVHLRLLIYLFTHIHYTGIVLNVI